MAHHREPQPIPADRAAQALLQEQRQRDRRWTGHDALLASDEFADYLLDRNLLLRDLSYAAHRSDECEQAALGAMLTDRQAIFAALERLVPGHFYHGKHALLYTRVAQLYNNTRPVDLVTVAEYLRRKGEIDGIGGAGYLAALLEGCPSAANIEAYCAAIIERWQLRQACEFADRLLATALGPDAQPAQLAGAMRAAADVIERGRGVSMAALFETKK